MSDTAHRLGLFRLINPSPAQLAAVTAAHDAIAFPWDTLAAAVAADTDRAVIVDWAPLSYGTAGLSYDTGLRITLSDTDTDTGFTFTHEVAHLVDHICLTPAARAKLTDLLHVTAGPVGHDACTNPNQWTTDRGDYYWRTREAYADQWVAAFAPTVWDGTFLPEAPQHSTRFIHSTTNHAAVRAITLDAAAVRPADTSRPDVAEPAEPTRLQLWAKVRKWRERAKRRRQTILDLRKRLP